jgi:hypothetical protein
MSVLVYSRELRMSELVSFRDLLMSVLVSSRGLLMSVLVSYKGLLMSLMVFQRPIHVSTQNWFLSMTFCCQPNPFVDLGAMQFQPFQFAHEGPILKRKGIDI